MRILTEENKVQDLDINRSAGYCSILSFTDFKSPDFFFRAITAYEQIECASASLTIGEHSLVVPFPWCLLVSDFDTVDCLPIDNLLGKSMPAFCINPIDGYRVEFLTAKLKMIYPSGNFIIPVLGNKDMLVVPLTTISRSRQDREGNRVEAGPLCVILSPTKMELSKPISEIW
jgi:hypothetical protein